MLNIKRLPKFLSAMVGLLFAPLVSADNPFTGQFFADNRPKELVYVSITQAESTVSGLLIIVSPDNNGKTDKITLTLEGLVDGRTITLRGKRLFGEYVMTGRREAKNLVLILPNEDGSVVPVTFSETTESEYSKILSEWQKLLADIQEEHSRRVVMERTMQQIRDTGLPSATEKLNRFFAGLESSLEDMRRVGASIAVESEKAFSCDQVYGTLKDLFYDSLHHGIYHGIFSDSARGYGSARQEILDRVENGRHIIEQLPIDYQAWRDSVVKAGLNSDEPSTQDIEDLISEYKGKIDAATNAQQASIEQARQLLAEGEDIYIQAGNRYERATQKCR